MRVFRVIVWLLVLFLFVGLFLPRDYRVSRTIEIPASPAKIHLLVNDLNQWPRWNPWQELEPSLRITLGDKTSGVGANQHWTDDSGGGRLSLIASSPSTGIIYNIWLNDAKSPALAHLNYITGQGNITRIEWSIEGEIQLPIVGFYLAQAMDSIIGPAFELGLKNLKREVQED
jgi:hypothetical protein